MSEENYDIIFKIVLIGDAFVGKTNIMSKYLNNEFNENSKSTVGVEFGSKTFKIEGKKIKAQIWDTAGQERYKSITSAYYKGAKGTFVVYDITRKETFESVDRWISELRNSNNKNLTVVLIGNKCDLEPQSAITKEQGEQKAKAYNAAFLETSALSGEKVSEAFELLMKEVYKNYKGEIDEVDEELKDIKFGNQGNLENINTKESTCC